MAPTSYPPSRTIPRSARRFATALLIIPFIFLSFPAAPADAAVGSWQQKGMSIYPFSPTDFSSDGFRSNVSHYKSLGFNTITLIIPLSQSNTGSTDIGNAGNTPTDASLTSAIEYIHAQGMQVMLKIHLDPRTGEWRANINPGDRDTWYANYLSMLQHYAQIAQAEHVEAYCIGTELIDMASPAINPDNTERWQGMIAAVRQTYHGQLTYDANWGSDTHAGEAQYIGFWPSLDFVGISAYYPLGAGIPVMVQNWQSVQNGELATVRSHAGNRPIMFTEIGYRSVDNAHAAPFDSWDGGNYNPQEQVDDYEALFEAFDGVSYMQGVDLWYADSDPNAGGPGNTDYFIQNKPVESTIQRWFGGSGSSTPVATAPAQFSITGSSPAAAQMGQSVTSAVSVANAGGAAFGTNVDLEVYNGSGARVAQQVFDSQDFAQSQSKTFSIPWTGNTAGTYTVKAGVFDSGWNLLVWNNSVSTISVGTNNPTTTPPTGTTTPPTGTTTPPSNTGAASFTATGSAVPSAADAGTPVGLTAQVEDTGGGIAGTNIDLEVYDQSGHQAFQKIYPNEDWSSTQSKTYQGSWTPSAAGAYTFKVGVFDSAWHLLLWNDAAAQISIGNSTPSNGGGGTTTPPTGTTTPPSNTGNGVIDLWWPTDGGTVSGVQPFKALLENADLSAYRMFWQVDGGQMNQMSDSTTDAPHKEALVDLGSWTWAGNGPYHLTFTAQNGSGASLGQKTISIFVSH